MRCPPPESREKTRFAIEICRPRPIKRRFDSLHSYVPPNEHANALATHAENGELQYTLDRVGVLATQVVDFSAVQLGNKSMSSFGSFGELRSRFDSRTRNIPPPETETPSATGSTQLLARGRELVGPIEVIRLPAIATPPEKASPAIPSPAAEHDGLSAARGILVGALLGSACWGLIAGAFYVFLA
jgi:hypothetical protein